MKYFFINRQLPDMATCTNSKQSAKKPDYAVPLRTQRRKAWAVNTLGSKAIMPATSAILR